MGWVSRSGEQLSLERMDQRQGGSDCGNCQMMPSQTAPHCSTCLRLRLAGFARAAGQRGAAAAAAAANNLRLEDLLASALFQGRQLPRRAVLHARGVHAAAVWAGEGWQPLLFASIPACRRQQGLYVYVWCWQLCHIGGWREAEGIAAAAFRVEWPCLIPDCYSVYCLPASEEGRSLKAVRSALLASLGAPLEARMICQQFESIT